jgi:signal transduction histidine kinase
MAIANRPPAAHLLILVASVAAISLLHYASNPHWLAVHELLKRAYYVPIVIAATLYGVTGGIATSILATVLFLPHIAMEDQGWPTEFGQYAEVVLFNTVALVTGLLADRLRAERNRYQTAADELQKAYLALKAHSDERTRIDRWATIGRLATGAAHEIRNPLGGLLGALEILESEFPPAHPKAGFVELAKADVRRLENVVSTFLEFAQPDPPASQDVGVGAILDAARRLAAPSLAARGVEVSIERPDEELIVHVDVEQCERALVNVLLKAAGSMRSGTIGVAIEHMNARARVEINIASSRWSAESIHHMFEPFAGGGPNGGLSLAVAKRLVENQHGTIGAEQTAEGVRIAIDLPRVSDRRSSISISNASAHARGAAQATEEISHGQEKASA